MRLRTDKGSECTSSLALRVPTLTALSRDHHAGKRHTLPPWDDAQSFSRCRMVSIVRVRGHELR
jgi:hypothetical protein